MGSKSSGSAHTPVEAKDSLKSTQFVRILDLLGEGSLSGWGNGGDSDDAMLKSTYFNDTPVLSETGEANFKGAKVAYLLGSEDQGYLPNFDTTENTVAVGTEVKNATPIVRTVTDSQLDRVIVTIRTGQMVRVNDQGDQNRTSVDLVVELMKDGATFSSRNVHIEGKTSDHFFRDVEFENLPEAPFQIRVRRVTLDSTSSKLQNQTYFASYVEIINAKLSYPHSAVVGVEFDSELFGASIPTRNYLVKGLQIKVPSNYDPVERTYSGFWDGTFKVAFSDNPAWIFYDLITSKRYGLGRKISPNQVDKWGLYSVAQYCDQLVDNGQGTMEPRFTCNAYLTESRQAYEVLQDLVSCFRGMYVWDGQNVSVTIDRKSDPVAMYTNSNVVDGVFSYSSSPLNTIATAVQIQYVDAADGYRTKTEYVSDDLAVRRYGLNVKRITSFGCTSRSQAIRTGKWLLETSRLERQTVTFSVGRAGLKHLPYDIIQVVDNDYAGVDMAGMIETVNQNLVTLDRPVGDLTGTEFGYLNTLGKLVTVEIVKQVSPTVLQLANVIVPHVTATFVIRSKGLGKRFFRALTISEDQDNGSYTINAVEHIPEKESVVDNGVEFEPAPNTIYDRLPVITGTQVDQDNSGIAISWSGSGSTEGVTYQVKVYRDNLLMDTYNDLITPSISLNNLKPGRYKLEIRARNKNGQWSEPQVREFDIDYSIYNFRATPKLWSVQLDWDLPNLSNSGLKTEIWVSASSSFSTAHKVADVASPTNTLTHSGLKLEDKYYYWARLVDKAGFTGEPVGPIEGESTKDPSAITEYIEGQITETALHRDLVNQWQSNIDTAISKEAQERVASIQQSSNAAASALLSTANQLGTRIDSVDNVTADLARQMSTVTAAQNGFASGLQTEILARIAGDQAEASARQTLAAQVGNNTSAINASSQAVSDLKTSTATQFTNVNARIDNINPDMLVGITLEAGWVSETNGTNQTLASHKRTKDYLPVYELVSYVARVTDVTADFSLRVVWYDQNKTFLSGSVTAKFTGAKSFTAPSGAMYVRVSWITAALKSISFTEVASSTASAVAADLADYKQAQAGTDAAQTLDINAAKSRLGVAEGSITNIQTTYAKKTEVVAIAQTGLQATWQADAQTKIDGIKVGGKNLLLNSGETLVNSAYPTKTYYLTETLTQSEQMTITLWGKKGSSAGDWVIYNSGGSSQQAKLVEISTDVWQAVFTWKPLAGAAPFNTFINVYVYPNQGTSVSHTIYKIKLERGNKGTDWSPAPEDTSTALTSVKSSIDVLQSTQASQNIAMTSMNTNLIARINDGNKTNSLVPGGDFTNPALWYSHYGTDLTQYFSNNQTSSPTAPVAFLSQMGGGLMFNYSSDTVVIEPNHTYKFSAYIFKSFDATGLFGFNWSMKTANSYRSKAVATVNGWSYYEVIMKAEDFGDWKVQPGFYLNHTGTAGYGMIAAYKFEDITFETKVQSLYTLKVEAHGARKAIAGIAIGADGQTGDAEVLILGNKFMIADPNNGSIKPMLSMAPVNGVNMLAINGNLVADGTILGKHIKASQTLYSPAISGGSMNIGNRFLVDSSGKVTIRENATTNKGLVMTNDSLKIYDEAGVLRVTLGKIS